MSDPLLQEYKEYYAARARRYEGNPNYRHSHEAERNLSSAMQSCHELEQFRDRIGNLNELCAIALIKDEYLMEQAHFARHEEHVRKQAADEILARADACAGVSDLVTMVQEVSQQVSIEISMDESHRQFHDDWSQMDLAEVYWHAEVPDPYRADMQQSSHEIRQKIAQGIAELENENHKWKPGWRFSPAVVLEHRHRRLLPFKDEHVRERLALYQQVIDR